MSGGFSFPPPPPPPPQTAQHVTPNQVEGHRGRGRGRGRGGGRGAFDGYGRGGGRGRGGGQPREASTTKYGASPPTGSYLNPSFSGPYQTSDLHSAPDSAKWRRSTTHTPSWSSSQTTIPLPPPTSFARTAAGHKRKLEALRPPSRENIPAPQMAPAVPGFGLPLAAQLPVGNPPVKDTISRSKVNGLGLVPSIDPQYSSSESEHEEVDEEAMHAELGAKLTFEHNGQVLSLSTPADLETWKQERRRNWPTHARMSEKDSERRRVGLERRRLLEEAAKLDVQALRTNTWNARENKRNAEKKHESAEAERGQIEVQFTSTEPQSELEQAKAKLDQQTNELQELRRRVEASQVRVRAQREAADEERKAADFIAQQKDNLVVTESASADLPDDTGLPGKADPDSSSADVSSSSGSESDSDSDSGPEEISTKQTPDPTTRIRPACRYFLASGYCRDGDACRFKHELPTRGSGLASQQTEAAQKSHPGLHHTKQSFPEMDSIQKKSIFERLLEQEQHEENRLALEVVKYLGKVGVFQAESIVDEPR